MVYSTGLTRYVHDVVMPMRNLIEIPGIRRVFHRLP